MSGYVILQSGSEEELKKAVGLVGPVSVGIYGSLFTFFFYKRGVYFDTDCSSTSLTHAALVVGYGVQDEQPFWLLKNSWGTQWGQEGYMMLARNRNNSCGVASYACYPVILPLCPDPPPPPRGMKCDLKLCSKYTHFVSFKVIWKLLTGDVETINQAIAALQTKSSPTNPAINVELFARFN